MSSGERDRNLSEMARAAVLQRTKAENIYLALADGKPRPSIHRPWRLRVRLLPR
jgi:hypothetical protein